MVLAWTGGVLPPAKVSFALFPRDKGPESTVVGAVTVTATCAAGAMVVVVTPPDVVVVVTEVGTVPRLQIN